MVTATVASAYTQTKITEHSLSPTPNSCIIVPGKKIQHPLHLQTSTHNIFKNKTTRLRRGCIIILPMFNAGGTAYCRWRMNWYRGSGWMRPSRTAPFTSAVPSSGSITYLTAMTPAITDGGTLAPPRSPGKSFTHHACTHQMIFVFFFFVIICMHYMHA